MWPLEERKQRVEAFIAIGLRALVLITDAHLWRVLLARVGAAQREVDAGSRPVPPPRLLVVGQRGGHLVGVRAGLRSG